jgi:hypothetical protein
VYLKAAEERTVFFENGTVTEDPPLTQVSRQVRREYLAIIALYTSRIIIKVDNLDFNPIMTYIAWCNLTVWKASSNQKQRWSRNIEIHLRSKNKPMPHAMEVLNRLDSWLCPETSNQLTEFTTTYKLKCNDKLRSCIWERLEFMTEQLEQQDWDTRNEYEVTMPELLKILEATTEKPTRTDA